MSRSAATSPCGSRGPDRKRAGAPRAATALSLVLVGMTACGNLITAVDAGRVGVTVDAAGQPVFVVMTCTPATPVIDLFEGRKPADPDTMENVHRGTWQARRGFAGMETIALAKPGGNWVPKRDPGTLESDRLFIVGGGTMEDDNANLAGVSFRIQDLAQLTPDQIKVDGKIQSFSSFGAYRCR